MSTDEEVITQAETFVRATAGACDNDRSLKLSMTLNELFAGIPIADCIVALVITTALMLRQSSKPEHYDALVMGFSMMLDSLLTENQA